MAAATSAGSLAWAIGFLIIFVPAGLGVREWSLGTLLVQFAALSPGQATLLAVVSRVGMIAAEVLVLLVGLQSQISKRQIKRRKNARWAKEIGDQYGRTGVKRQQTNGK
jgi:hypothetical protein